MKFSKTLLFVYFSLFVFASAFGFELNYHYDESGQRRDGSKLFDIVYELTELAPTDTVNIFVYAITQSGETLAYSTPSARFGTFSGDTVRVIGSGVYHIIWNIGIDAPNREFYSDSIMIHLIAGLPGYEPGPCGLYAYVADGDDGLRIIDVSDPTAPVEVGFYDTGDWAFGVYVVGSYAYVADYWDGLRIINVSVPSAPFEVGFYDMGERAIGVYVVGTYAYVADDYDGLRIIDVSDPTTPFEVGFYDTGDAASGVYVVGTYAYVADGNDGLRIIDVSDPTAPAEVGFYNTGGDAFGVYAAP